MFYVESYSSFVADVLPSLKRETKAALSRHIKRWQEASRTARAALDKSARLDRVFHAADAAVKAAVKADDTAAALAAARAISGGYTPELMAASKEAAAALAATYRTPEVRTLVKAAKTAGAKAQAQHDRAMRAAAKLEAASRCLAEAISHHR